MKALGKGSIAARIKVVLDVAWYFIAVSLALMVCLLAASPFLDSIPSLEVAGPNVDIGPSNVTLSLPVFLDVDADAYRVQSTSLGIERAEIRNIQADLRFPARKGVFYFANMGIIVALLAFGLWVLTLLRRVFQTLRDGRPFDRANAGRIRWIGLAFIIGELARTGLGLFWSYYAGTHFTAGGMRFVVHPDLSITGIVTGLIVVVIAEVFRQGTQLEDEQSLTV